MLARKYCSKDARGLDIILGNNRAGDVRLDRDEIVVTGNVGDPSGVLVYRPGAFVHELECRGSLLRAEALANFAVGQALEKGLRSAIFCVRKDNAAMIRFVKSLGAVEQGEGQLLFTLTP